MTFPAFDERGNLPVGDLFDANSHRGMLHLSLADARRCFVDEMPDSQTRQVIWAGWMQHRLVLESLGLNYVTLVDGSFVTAKTDPNDVDICLFLNEHELNALPAPVHPVLFDLFDVPRSKLQHRCDAYMVPIVPAGHGAFPNIIHAVTYWVRVFGRDRNDNEKSFVLVTERGVL